MILGEVNPGSEGMKCVFGAGYRFRNPTFLHGEMGNTLQKGLIC